MANLRQASLRHANLALVARTVLGAGSPPSRAEVASTTSLTRSTVSRLVDELVAGGVLAEVGSVVGGPGRPGRPATPLVASTGRFAALGLQVGVGHLAARLVDLSGTVLAERHVVADLAGSRPGPALRRLRTLAAGVLGAVPAGCHVVGAGLALPGIVDADEGRLLRAPNLGWADVVPGPMLSAVLGGLGLRVGNEADLAAHAFAHPAPGRDSEPQDFVYLSGEVGIGGAIVVDGGVMAGRHGWAGEIGHVCVDPDGPACACGSTGCLEQYAGRLALLAAAGLDAATTPAEMVARVRDGDEKAQAAIRAAARALGVALAGVVNVLDIPTMVLGGHLAQVGELLAPEIEQILGRRVLSAAWVRPRVVVAPDDPAPGATGAALLALDDLVRDPAGVLGTS
ncbi:ROK family transcriptional regulator [Terrabacter aerolatus]|uniref:Xylose repressor n=1 Tax=Terrabacter aerolatus TaxID=422442 RepID=A0A512CWR9_9MICO|nr:ROK family transcriptional regulator [Terrabacter aerolatus]GEO28671.1 xylose repressor [Terrabacter aerolatus]